MGSPQTASKTPFLTAVVQKAFFGCWAPHTQAALRRCTASFHTILNDRARDCFAEWEGGDLVDNGMNIEDERAAVDGASRDYSRHPLPAPSRPKRSSKQDIAGTGDHSLPVTILQLRYCI